MDEKIELAIKELMVKLEEDDTKFMAKAVFKGQYGKPSNSWSFLNRLIMLCNGTDDARTYRTWLKVNRHVKKGSKAFYILKPVIKTIKKDGEDEDEEDEILILGFRPIPEFKIEDTEGDPLPVDNFVADIPVQFNKIISDLDLDIKTSAFNGGFYGSYKPATKEIILASPELSTFLHELSHAVDDLLHGIKGGQIRDQEIIAEFGAAVIGRLLGYDMSHQNFVAYIKSYGGGAKDIIRLLARLDKIISYVVENTTNN